MIIEIPEQVMFYLPYVVSAILPLVMVYGTGFLIGKRRERRFQKLARSPREVDASTSFTIYRVNDENDIVSIWKFNDASIARSMEKSEKAQGVHGRLYHNKKLVREW